MVNLGTQQMSLEFVMEAWKAGDFDQVEDLGLPSEMVHSLNVFVAGTRLFVALEAALQELDELLEANDRQLELLFHQATSR